MGQRDTDGMNRLGDGVRRKTRRALEWLAPPSPRYVPYERTWNVALRTVHLMAFGLLLGGHAWGVDSERLLPALWVTVGSGGVLMAIELYKTVHWLFLGKGLSVVAKLLLLLFVPFFWEARVPLLLAVIALASVGAHMPARFRHYSVLEGRIVGTAPAGPAGSDHTDEADEG